MNNYNTDINVIGSIPDYELIYKAIELFSQNEKDLESLIITDNQFNFRTERSRKRFLSAVYSAFLNFKDNTHIIWHLSSGVHGGFECYIIIYKWSRDNLLRLRSVYIEHRQRALENRQIDLQNDNSAKAQNEKDIIYKQLAEIED